jgi:hypothetical protein
MTSEMIRAGDSGAYGHGGLKSMLSMPRQWMVGLLLVIALFAFELFNFDTTRFALADLLGDVSFAGVAWAGILAVAFCAIDFAGLAHLLTPDRDDDQREAWYLMGAWLLGATMNAVMTWWAVNLTLLSHDFGNEVLTREQLLQFVPPFVAVLVWLTRILFIGAFSVAGAHLFQSRRQATQPASGPVREPAFAPVQAPQPAGVTLSNASSPQPTLVSPTVATPSPQPAPSRQRNRPPMPRPLPAMSMSARARQRA